MSHWTLKLSVALQLSRLGWHEAKEEFIKSQASNKSNYLTTLDFSWHRGRTGKCVADKEAEPSALTLLPSVIFHMGYQGSWRDPGLHGHCFSLTSIYTTHPWSSPGQLNAISTTQTSGHSLQGWVGRGTVVLYQENGTELPELVFQTVLPGGMKGLKLWLQSSIAVSREHLLFSSASLLKRMRKSQKAQTLPFNVIFLSKSETILKKKLWQSLYSKSEHLHPWIVFGFF